MNEKNHQKRHKDQVNWNQPGSSKSPFLYSSNRKLSSTAWKNCKKFPRGLPLFLATEEHRPMWMRKNIWARKSIVQQTIHYQWTSFIDTHNYKIYMMTIISLMYIKMQCHIYFHNNTLTFIAIAV